MDERLVDLRSTKNPKARIKIMKGHFATSHSHINTYIDMSTVKVRHNNCRETAKVFADEFAHTTMVDTIVCLEETDTIGAFMAEQLADVSIHSLSHGNNISIVSPEYHDFLRMIEYHSIMNFATFFKNSGNLTSLKLSEYTLINKDYKYYQK